MKQRIRTILRWSGVVVSALGAAFCLYWSIYAAWQTVAPPGNQVPGQWQMVAARYSGWALALLFLALLLALGRRPGPSGWRAIAAWVLVALMVAATVWPELWQFLRVDRCLDQGGAWDLRQGVCKGGGAT